MTDIRYPSRALNSATDSVSIATVGTSLDVNLHDGGGTAITSQVSGSQQALDVGVNVAGVQVDPRDIRALTNADVVSAEQSGTWTVEPGNTPNTTPWLITVNQGGNSATVTAGNALKVDGSASTQPVSGSVTANQGGTWDLNNITGTVSLPTGAATAAKQPALGTAGTASADVITVQGIASMVALKVDGSAVTQPVSGTVTANQGGTWTVQPGNTANTTPWLVTLNQGGNSATVTASNALKVDGSAVTQPVSIASLPAGGGRSTVLLYTNNYASVNVTTSAYVQVVASTTGDINRLYIADTSGSAIILAVGGAGSEVDKLYIGPGGNEAPYELNIPSGSRIAIKALDVNATSGRIILTALS